MSRDLEKLTLNQLIALGFQNDVQMKMVPKGFTYKEHLVKKLSALEVIKGLETKEDGQQKVS